MSTQDLIEQIALNRKKAKMYNDIADELEQQAEEELHGKKPTVHASESVCVSCEG